MSTILFNDPKNEYEVGIKAAEQEWKQARTNLINTVPEVYTSLEQYNSALVRAQNLDKSVNARLKGTIIRYENTKPKAAPVQVDTNQKQSVHRVQELVVRDKNSWRFFQRQSCLKLAIVKWVV